MKRNKVTLVFGRKGQGKSFFIKRALDRLSRRAQLLVWDPQHEYAGRTGVDSIHGAVVYTDWLGFLTAQASTRGPLGRVVIQAHRRHFAHFCAYALACGNLTVVIDELHKFVHSTSFPEAFADLLYDGRHVGVDVIAIAWRPYGLPPFLRGAADEIRAFACTEPNDLKWFEQVCSQEFVKKLPLLSERRSLLWTPSVSATDAKSRRG